MDYLICECTGADCKLRFPVPPGETPPAICPRCGEVLRHETARTTFEAHADRPPQPPLSALLDSLRSVFNVGSIFRIADGAGLAHLYLCGTTATPEHPKLPKTALGAEHAVAWSYHPNAVRLADELRAQGIHLWALENTPGAISLFDAPPRTTPTVLVVGNEVTGVDPALLARCDAAFFLPMHGVKRSLNVAVAFGIATYGLQFGASRR